VRGLDGCEGAGGMVDLHSYKSKAAAAFPPYASRHQVAAPCQQPAGQQPYVHTACMQHVTADMPAQRVHCKLDAS
jgi:hypothetical protein